MKYLYPQGLLFGYSKKKKEGGLVWSRTWNSRGTEAIS